MHVFWIEFVLLRSSFQKMQDLLDEEYAQVANACIKRAEVECVQTAASLSCCRPALIYPVLPLHQAKNIWQ
jgi:hypothetical protein